MRDAGGVGKIPITYVKKPVHPVVLEKVQSFGPMLGLIKKEDRFRAAYGEGY
jgi:hypothetical protein